MKCYIWMLCLFLTTLECTAEFIPQNFAKDLHADRLQFLKDKGFNPKIIYDIGAFRGHWSYQIKGVFPEAQFYLFEGNENNKPYLDNTPFQCFYGVLGDANKTVTFFTNNTTGDSVFREQTKYYEDSKCLKKNTQMVTLDSVVSKNKLPSADLIKIDVQGAEKLIIQGSPDLIKKAQVVILETKILEYNANSPLVFEIMSLMNDLGFRVLDILEFHYLPSGELNEIDLLFVKKDSPLIKTGLLIN